MVIKLPLANDANIFKTFRLYSFQWATFHDLYNQLEKWVQDTERIVVADVELKNTLPEKKAQLQHYRVSYLELNKFRVSRLFSKEMLYFLNFQ